MLISSICERGENGFHWMIFILHLFGNRLSLMEESDGGELKGETGGSV